MALRESLSEAVNGRGVSAEVYYDTGPTVTIKITGNAGYGLRAFWRVTGTKSAGDYTTHYIPQTNADSGSFVAENGHSYAFQAVWGEYNGVSNGDIFTVNFNSGGSSGGGSDGDDDLEEIYTVTLDKGGYTWDEFPLVTEYYDYYGKTINLSAPKRDDNTIPAGNFNIVGNSNGSEKNIAIQAAITKRTTYTFKGWKDLNDNKVYSTTYQIYGNATLSAQQSSSSTLIYSNNKIENLGHPTRDEEVKAYTITYNYDGGTLSKESETSNARLSYKFDYWCSNSSGTGTKYDESYEFKKNDGEEVNVYAIWTTTIEEPATVNLPTTEKVGFKFRGWTTADQAILYEAGTSVEVTKDTEFVAVWESEGRVFIHDGTKWIPVI